MASTLRLTEVTAGSAEVVDADGRRVATLERRTLVRSGIRDQHPRRQEYRQGYGTSTAQESFVTESDVWSWTTSHPGTFTPVWHGAFATRREALADLTEAWAEQRA